MSRSFIFISASFVLCIPVKGETGTPHVKVFPPNAFSGEYVSGPQNAGIIQSKKGLMYFGNGYGILEFDGYYWRMIKGSSSLSPRSFALDSKGTVYAGGKDDFGYLAPDSSGELRFHSLLKMLSEPDKGFGIIYHLYALGDEIYFLTGKQLMRYEGYGIKVWRAESKFLGGYIIDGKLYLEQEATGLMKLSGDEIKLVLPANEELTDLDIIHYFKSLCPCNSETDHLIGKDENNDYYLFNGNERLVKIKPRVSEFLNAQRGIEKTARTADGKTAIATLSGGVMVVDQQGEFIDLIDEHDGVADNIANALFIDAADGLWIAHDKGISRTQLNSPLNFIDPRSGFTGIIVSITRFEDKLYVSTTDGVYVEMPGNFNCPVNFERIAEIENQAFTLLKTNNSLLVASILGVFEIKGKRAEKIADGIATDLAPSGTSKNLVYATLSGDIIPIEFVNGKWTAHRPVPGIHDVIYKIIAGKNDIIWASNFLDKLYRVDLAGLKPSPAVIMTLDSSNGLPFGWVEPFRLGDEVYFGTLRGVFQFDPVTQTLRHSNDKRFDYFNARNQEAGPVRTDRHGNIWVVSNGKAGKLSPNAAGAYQWDSTATMGIPESSIWSFYADDHDIIWLGTTDFLVRYDAKKKRNNNENFPTYIRKVVLGSDSLLFMGAGEPASSVPEFTFKHNDFTFEYSSPFFEGENSYSVKLEGNDDRWSAWSKETKIRYTNLSPGTYAFKVKAKNIYAQVDSEAIYAFTVQRPFYFTIWAFIAYALLLGLIIWGIVVWNLRRLVRSKRRLERIVNERTVELNLINEELRKAKEFEEQFLANMSHEIRTPMHAVVGLTNLMLKDALPPRHAKYLKAIRQSSDNMLMLINDILDVSKIQSGKLEIEAVDFSIKKVLDDVLNVMQLQIDEKSLKVKSILHPDVPDYVIGDPLRLNEIILNLLNNAVKFTEKGSITISCRVLEKNDADLRLEFSVEDTGMGIASEKLETLFTYFGQGGKEVARKFGGSGLGLLICKQLVELQNGRIWVQSKAGKGTIFFFTILYGVSRQTLDKKPAHPARAGIRPENLDILLVENNAFNQMVAKDALESLIKNVKVDIAENGSEAVSLVIKNNYDVVLMDLLMPVMDGYEATRKIRQLPPPKNKVKIIAVSACSTSRENEECKVAGMDEYLAKPFRDEELLQKITGILDDASPRDTSINKFIRLDCLENIAKGDAVKRSKYINMYLQGVPGLLASLKKAIEDRCWNDIRESAHSMIPYFHYVGALSLKKLAEEIERRARAAEKPDEIARLAEELEAGINNSYTELNTFLELPSVEHEKDQG